MSTVDASRVVVQRLLAGVTATAPGADLAAHLRTHGALDVPRRPEPGWSDAMAGELAASGLAGRGGGGFPLARKVAAIRGQRHRPVLVVNVVESEPASMKDSVLALHAPHLVLDGVDVLAAISGAAEVRICVDRRRGAVSRSLVEAIARRRRAGMQSVRTSVLGVPPRYVAGEESALTHWLDGGDARPVFRSPRPGKLQIGRMPALIDNAETLAHAALVARHGAGWFRQVGCEEMPGTMLVTLSRASLPPQVCEVPIGTSAASVLAAAQVANAHDVSANHASADDGAGIAGVLFGGYGGAWLSRAQLEVPLSRRGLAGLGWRWGVGVMVVIAGDACALAETARIAQWMAAESAGQCGPCVFGLPAIAADLVTLAFGRPDPSLVARLRRRTDEVNGRGACGHPDGVVQLVRSALVAFDDHVRRHVADGPCPGSHAASVMPLPTGSVDQWR